MTPLLQREDCAVYHAGHDWLGELATVGRCDLLCVDAPYSDRTHAGHDGAVEATCFRPEDERRTRVDKRTGATYAVGANRRRAIDYDAWQPEDVASFVELWSPRTAGWLLTLTDHVLAPVWAEHLERLGRYVFSPIACVEPGSRVRIVGDGPGQWSTWLVAARPRTKEFASWGMLPGAYVLPPGHRQGLWQKGRKEVAGGKPLWLMERLIEDYSKPGDLVCDPCCGGGTTLLAALQTGRRAIGGDAKLEHAQLTANRLSRPVQRPLFGGAA